MVQRYQQIYTKHNAIEDKNTLRKKLQISHFTVFLKECVQNWSSKYASHIKETHAKPTVRLGLWTKCLSIGETSEKNHYCLKQHLHLLLRRS